VRLQQTQNSSNFVNIACTEFYKNVTKMYKIREKFHVRPSVQYDFYFTEFHETFDRLVAPTPNVTNSLLREEHPKIADTVVHQTVRRPRGKTVKCLLANKPPMTTDSDKNSRCVAVGIAAFHNHNKLQ
jgi:hypothetical protein